MPALLLPNEILSMSAQAARRLVEAGDGDGALLYLALLECGGDGDKAANRLHWPGERLNRAFKGLAALELAQPPAQGMAAQPQELETAICTAVCGNLWTAGSYLFRTAGRSRILLQAGRRSNPVRSVVGL